MTVKITVASLACLLTTTNLALADGTTHANSHAPIGVMGDHLHDAGEVMFSYRFMRMNMEGNNIGTDGVSPETIATTIPNRFFGNPMQPPTLRIVPTEMTMDMHMFGAMYAPTDRVTLMAMGMYVVKEMDHITFMGPSGTTRLGNFTTKSSGFGDTVLSALIGLMDQNGHKLHLNAGIGLPTGSTTESDDILTPMGATPRVRMPYAMQLGTGTFDLRPGLTYFATSDALGWGAQYAAEIRLGDNDEGYAFGDLHQLTAWVSYEPAPWISFSGRIVGKTRGEIDGMDPRIMGPVQTADPDNYDGEQIDAVLGVNLAGQSGAINGHRLAIEFGVPLHQDLNGPQMETDWTFTLGWQKAL